MKKVMFIGSIGCGKTTLCQRIKGVELSYHKTQAVQFHANMIDTPGEFIQHRQYYSALTVTAAEAEVVALLASVSEKEQVFAPLFATLFAKPTIGIVTKIDLAENEADILAAEKRLYLAGAKMVFRVSSYEDAGIKELVDYLQ
ncbi:EutP/PduV family microcompartment system protein [Carnobacterium maltaromaticum]|uniref:EutP/PduV family microcompartment system protein n=1 Tax=Carnobacterium maltaromaticum TaxID=2751 RepID=UPI00295E821F|nr:EutP/PduV family microcompartment system protein [Carnobacterium maltaromaticum]